MGDLNAHMSWVKLCHRNQISLRLLLAIAIVVVPRAIASINDQIVPEAEFHELSRKLVRENHGPGVPRRRREEGMKTAGFDEEQFMKNGPHQQGTIKIDRSKLQTVVTICSPTLLQMAVYDDVDLASVQKYDQSSDGSPLQISVTVFPPTLPFPFASNYGEPSYVTVDCSPASVATTLSTTPPSSTDLEYALDQGASQDFTVTGTGMRAVMVDCTSQTAGLIASTEYEYGQKGGVALIPAGALPVSVVGECGVTGNEFAIRIASLIGSDKDTQHRMIQNFILSSAITWDDTTELVWEFAYGGLVNVTVTNNVTGMVYYNYKTGCRVQMTFKTVPERRADLSVVQAETSTAPGVTATGLDTATGAASMASAVTSVKKSNSHYSGVASVLASNFQSVGQAYTYTGTFAGGSFAPSAAPEDHDSELDEYLIIVGVVGAAVLIAIIVLIAVKMSARPTPAKADVEIGQVGVTSVPLEPTPKEGN